MASDEGWIKIWRRLLKDKLWSGTTDAQFRAAIGLFLAVNWSEEDWACKKCGAQKRLSPGQTAKSLRQLSTEINVSFKVLQKTVLKLESFGIILREKSAKRDQCHTILTVKNWHTYQGELADLDDSGIAEGISKGIAEGSARGSQRVSDSIYKKIRRSSCSKSENFELSDFPEPPKEQKTVAPLPTEAYEMADLLQSCILKEKPDHKIGKGDWLKNPQRDKWARELDLANRRDGRSWSDLAAVIRWATRDSFWAPNIQSAAKLRKQFDRLQAQMRRPRTNNRPSADYGPIKIMDPNS